jgi:orotidine-5'-phosphate decarboxylase
MLGVTVLTSLDKNDLERVGVGGDVADQVTRLALLTKDAGMDGVVAAPHEVPGIRLACGKRFVIVAAGIRPAGGKRNDQKRVMTPRQAVEAGVDYIVVGRPILEARDPCRTVREMIADMEEPRR